MQTKVFIVLLGLFVLSGCSSHRQTPAPLLDLSYDRSQFLYHQVGRDETMSDIANAYDVNESELYAANHLSPRSSLKRDSVVKIPQYIAQSKPTRAKKTVSKPLKLPTSWGKLSSLKYTAREDQRGGWIVGLSRQVNVISPASGRVIFVGENVKDLGHLVLIDHGNHRVSTFGLLENYVVHKGDRIKKGQKVGRSSKNNDGKSMFYYDIRKK